MGTIHTEQLTKHYGDTVALDGLDLTVERGELFGFLGPNGAGKSTAIRLLLDLIRPTAGRASILGLDCQADSVAVRAKVGYLPGDLRLYGGLTGQDTVELFSGLREHPVDTGYVRTLAGELELDLSKHANALSKGNRQKLGLLLALMSRPEVLLLDEPTSGLDPLLQHTVWNLLRREADRGATVFFSSHVMSEVEQVCERVAILRRGRLVAVETVAGLKGRALRHVGVTFAGAVPPPGAIDTPGVREIHRGGPTVEFEVAGEFQPLLVALADYHVTDLRTEQPMLDEVLLAFYTGAPR
ncbi:MAG: ABC transporter ATP-binding protein [Dehalococcoidia bacterium]|nr:ABC transporter ATP-binding protein [Dehalococcoidia bacterium]